MPGDRIIAREGSTVINRSNVVNAFNRLGADATPETRAAINSVLEAIEKSGDKSAGVIFEKLLDDLGNKNHDRSTLQGYWKTIVQLVPAVATMADAAAKITALF
jgi:hypothetical protein